MKLAHSDSIVLRLWLAAIIISATSAHAAVPMPQPVTLQQPDGRFLCNPDAALPQIPGHPDLFVGYVNGIEGDCHHPSDNPAKDGTLGLALLKMNWETRALVFQNFILRAPVKTPSGVNLHTAYDPFVASHNGEIWVAFECTVPGAVSSCIAPLTSDFKSLDLTRLSVPAVGRIGPNGPNGQLVCSVSASVPTLLSYKGHLYLYWQIDYYDNLNPENKMVTRGMELREDARGLLWGAGSDGRSVYTDDPRLTLVVHDVNNNDQTADHVASMTDAFVVGGKIVEFASIGGTAGQQVCRSPHDLSQGCWRMSVSVTDNPLGYNVFGGQHVRSGVGLPLNVISYPRIMVDASGRTYLFGNFQSLKVPSALEGRIPYPVDPPHHNAEYFPLELNALENQ